MATEMMMDNGRKYIVQDEENKYATKGLAGTALGFGIGATALEFLKNGGLQGILSPSPQNQEESSFGLYKGYRDADDAIIAKHNADSFALYKYSRDSFDAMQKEIADLKAKLAVAEATQPWKDKSIYDAIALEAERRECNDGKIVNYVNNTFVPRYISELTVGTGATQTLVYNPLCTPRC